MDGMTLFLILLLGMTIPIAAVVIAILVEAAIVGWFAARTAYRGVTAWRHSTPT
ncbi:MAG TPA: hypothetical protein VFB46_04990 [Gemmatimonadaceae bacterium]|nr:hypothetical protein [Gemmatimonadaceae bacterium]